MYSLKQRLPLIALCSDSILYSNNHGLSFENAVAYPGALWLPALVDSLSRENLTTMTGDVALRHVLAGDLDPRKIWIIQENMSSDADKLFNRGAHAKVLLCCESPLFAHRFYLNLNKTSQRFDHAIMFSGAIKQSSPRIAAHILYFPSLARGLTFGTNIPWQNRKYMVMVAGNKYSTISRPFMRGIAAYIRDIIFNRRKYLSNPYSSLQLHDRRLEAISFFGSRNQLDLFGDHWNKLENLPMRWRSELSPLITRLKPVPCPIKSSTIAQYKYALCFENMEFPGYVTEKIFDCMAAGVVPVYLGAPDIVDFVPGDCFVNVRNFPSINSLGDYLINMGEREWKAKVSSAELYLSSSTGIRHSHSAFADQIASLILSDALL